jgi:hypothetical protein
MKKQVPVKQPAKKSPSRQTSPARKKKSTAKVRAKK